MSAEVRLVDTHCHLDFSEFDGGREELLSESRRSGIVGLVVPAVKRSSWASLLSMAENYKGGAKIALGLHPYFIESHQESDLLELESHLSECPSSCVAVGEIGLDATVSEYKQQEYFFDRQLELAARFSLPVVIHSRKTHSQVYKKVKLAGVSGGVIHAFSGSRQEAEAFLSLGLKLGVGPVITWPRAAKTRSVLSSVGLESLVLETDAPDMPIFSKAKGQGSPLDVLAVLDSLCEIRSEPRVDIAEQLLRNSAELFRCAQWLKNGI